MTEKLHALPGILSWLPLVDRVLVTCQAGVNRSSLVAAMALIQSGWTATGAIERIRERRDPPIGMMPLENRIFVQILKILGKRGTRAVSGGLA